MTSSSAGPEKNPEDAGGPEPPPTSDVEIEFETILHDETGCLTGTIKASSTLHSSRPN
jgi:hypothetical protein